MSTESSVCTKVCDVAKADGAPCNGGNATCVRGVCGGEGITSVEGIGGAGNTTPIAFGGGDPVVGDTWVSEFGSDNSM